MTRKKIKSLKLGKLFSFFISPFLFSTILSSCGLLGRNIHSGLKISAPFTLNNSRTIAIKELAKKYNTWVETNNKKAEGYLPITSVHNSTHYSINSAQLLNQLSAKDYDSLPNISIGYASNIYDLAFNGNYLLDFSKSTKEAYNNQNNYDNDKIDKSIFSDSFLQMNKIIDIADENGLYLIPSGSSVEALYINRIVLNYLINKIITSNKVSIKSQDTEFFKQQFGIQKNGSSKVTKRSAPSSTPSYSVTNEKTNTAKAAYGDPDLDSIKDNIELSASMFENYEDFFKLANLLNNAYPNKKGTILAYGKTNAYELGTFLKGNAEYKDFLWNKKHNEQTYNYSFYGEKAGEGRSKNLKEVYDLFYGLKDHNGIWKKLAQNAYPSSDFKKNKVLFSMGSISGFNYHIGKKTKEVEEKDIFLTLNPYKYSSSSNQSGFIVQGGSFFGISFNDPKVDHATRLFMKWMVGEQNSNKVDYEANNKNEQVRPLTYYALKGNYMPGFKDFTTNTDNQIKFMSSFSKKFVYELFTKLANNTSAYPQKKASNGDKFSWGIKIPSVASTKVFVEPVGELSGAFRSVTDSSESLGESQMPNFEEFWLRLKTNFQIQYWINKNQALIQETKNKDAAAKSS